MSMPAAQFLFRGPLIRPYLDVAIVISRRAAYGVGPKPNTQIRRIPHRLHSTAANPPISSKNPEAVKINPSSEAQNIAHEEPHLLRHDVGKIATESQAQAQAHSIPEPAPKTPNPIPSPATITPRPFWQRLGPITRAGEAYGNAQRAHPWATQVFSALAIYLLADFGAQQMNSGTSDLARELEDEDSERKEVKRGGHDWARTARALLIGGTSAIPGYIWFSYLSRNFNYPSRVLSIALKVAINQAVFTPIFNVYFFGSQALLSGDSISEAWRRVCNTVPVSLINSVKLWPAVTAFSFAFVPFEYRSIFGGVVAVGWQTYLSFLNARAERMEMLRQREERLSGRASLDNKEKDAPTSTEATVTVAVAAEAAA
ncbi:hypothetical protein GGS20DRAFT_541513 [Poronia punctata]|nr:hypothetical protein GGS20DRAFT_541513 [Poronia punctata]